MLSRVDAKPFLALFDSEGSVDNSIPQIFEAEDSW